jgi:hypothetical protein
MTISTADDLIRSAAAEELQIAALRRDGTPRNPVTIYRTKYRRYPERFVSPVVSTESRSVTLKLVPRPAA